MKKLLILSVIYSAFITALGYFFRIVLNTPDLLADIGGISVFASIFGTLFGILTAFIVVEVWNQYNKTSELIDSEASGLEKVYRLSLFFRDDTFSGNIKNAISEYINTVVKDNFKSLGEGKRNSEASRSFRNISAVIRDVRFDDDHDNLVFSHMITSYDELSAVRSNRISQSLSRLPLLLRIFLYACVGIAMTILLFLPFQSLVVSMVSIASLSFILVMVLLVIEDLDNPFVGAWNISSEPFERAREHIEIDY